MFATHPVFDYMHERLYGYADLWQIYGATGGVYARSSIEVESQNFAYLCLSLVTVVV